jgi:hypothetical protein
LETTGSVTTIHQYVLDNLFGLTTPQLSDHYFADILETADYPLNTSNMAHLMAQVASMFAIKAGN